MTDLSMLSDFICQAVAKELERPSLTHSQCDYVIRLYNHMDRKIFIGYKMSVIGPILGKILGDKLVQHEATESIDPSNYLHEHQIKTLSSTELDPVHAGAALIANPNYKTNLENSLIITEFMGINDLSTLKLMMNPSSMYVHYYLAMDSDYRNIAQENNTNIKSFTWSYAATLNRQIGFCNSVGSIRDIIGMRMYQPRIPYLAAMNNDSKRVSVLIEELSAQSFISETGRRFHFLLRPNYISGQTDIELSTEDYNDGIYNFRKPISSFDTITISFGDPLTVLSFAEPFNRFMIAIEFVCFKSDT